MLALGTIQPQRILNTYNFICGLEIEAGLTFEFTDNELWAITAGYDPYFAQGESEEFRISGISASIKKGWNLVPKDSFSLIFWAGLGIDIETFGIKVQACLSAGGISLLKLNYLYAPLYGYSIVTASISQILIFGLL